MRVARDDALAHLRCNETEYWFCSLDCIARFASQPETFVRSGQPAGPWRRGRPQVTVIVPTMPPS